MRWLTARMATGEGGRNGDGDGDDGGEVEIGAEATDFWRL